MNELKQLRFPAIYSQLASDFLAGVPLMQRLNTPLTRVFELLRIPLATLDDPHATLNGKQVEMLLAAGNMIADKSERFSVQLCRQFREDTLGLLGLALVNSANGGEALKTFQKYIFLYSPGIDFHFHQDQTHLEVTLRPLVRFDRTVENILFEIIFCAVGFYMQRAGITLTPEYHLPYSIGEHKDEFETFTRGVLLENTSEAKVRFPIEALETPLARPNLATYKLYIEQLDKQAEAARASESFSLKARRYIEHQAQQGRFISRDDLAEHMAVSVRTLNRKLKDDGLSFQPLLDQARFAIARRLLIDSDKTTKQIAYEVGIQNPAVFCRAFKKWSGKTPGDFRDRFRR